MSARDEPDEPSPDDESAGDDESADDGPLSVQVDGDRREPTRLFVLSRSRGDLVEVREIRAGCAPLEYTSTADELLTLFERASRDRRRMSESLYAIRLWLDGTF